MDNQPQDKPHSLAFAHWDYLRKTLLVHGLSKKKVDIIGHHYTTAFIHGYKHGVEDTESCEYENS